MSLLQEDFTDLTNRRAPISLTIDFVMSTEPKLTKKQLKAQQFRKSRDDKEADKKRALEQEQVSADAQPAKKKRKTRRGKGGKGSSKKGNRFIIFVGSLPPGITETELQAHFKSSSPDTIRLRPDKNIAFLEFDPDKDTSSIQKRMDVALLQHKTLLKGKRINVELTVGGGGNSQQRLEKLKLKNEKMEQERSERMKALIAKNKSPSADSIKSSSTNPAAGTGVHPDRAKLIE